MCETQILAEESRPAGEDGVGAKVTASSGLGLFDEGFLPDDDDDSGFGDVKAAAVCFEIKPDLGMLRQCNVAVDDGVLNARVAADNDVIVDDGIRNVRITVDAHVVTDDRAVDAPAGN